MKSIDIIVGARPNFIKVAPIIKAIERFCDPNLSFSYRLVHTGQHYDKNLSDIFFTQLNIPKPHINLEIKSGNQSNQTASIICAYDKLLAQSKCKLCLVVGDVTSTMACALTAQKHCIPVAHVEGGIRSNDWSMPEEINRLVTDSISNFFFTTSSYANQNLIKSGVSKNRIFYVGNTMIDTLLNNMYRFKKPCFWIDYSLKKNEYFVVTMHRPSNVDEGHHLVKIISELSLHSRDLPIIFPVHPRTKKILLKFNDFPNLIHFTDPLPYLEFNYLVKHSKAVITDSGGITEETTVMGVPCITLRDSTERPETVSIGTNKLIGSDITKIKPTLDLLFDGKWKRGSIPPLWDGKTGERIVTHLVKLLE